MLRFDAALMMIVLFMVFILGCGMGRYHIAFDSEEPQVVDRATGLVCERDAWGFTSTTSEAFYADPCDVIIKHPVHH